MSDTGSFAETLQLFKINVDKMRKPDVCPDENKDEDKLRSNYESAPLFSQHV